MVKQFKTKAAKIIAVMLTLALLTGCSSSDGKDGGETPSQATPAVTDTESTPTDEPENNTTDAPQPTEDASGNKVTDEPATTSEPSEEKANKVISKNDYKSITVEYKTKDLESVIDMTDITKVYFSDDGIKVEGKKEVRVTNVNGRQTATFTAKGKYLISGECSNGQIIVLADNDKDVRLCLNGLRLTCPDSAAIYEKQCDKLLITLVGGTENYLESTSDYIYEDTEKKNPDACIFAKDDLVINGNGSLTIKTAKSEGIHSTDSVKLVSGRITVESGDRGIRGKEFITVKNADITIKSGADAMRTTEENDENLGYIVIEGGNIDIDTSSEGIQATGNIQITGGTISIKAEGKKSNAMKSDKYIYIEDAEVTVNSENSIKAGSGIYTEEGTVTVKG